MKTINYGFLNRTFEISDLCEECILSMVEQWKEREEQIYCEEDIYDTVDTILFNENEKAFQYLQDRGITDFKKAIEDVNSDNCSIYWIATYYLREEFEIALLNLGVKKDA